MTRCLKIQRRWSHSYQDYLRVLQNQVVQDVKLLEGGNPTNVKKKRKVTYNKLAHSPEAPRDPVIRLRDMDRIRELTETVGGDMKMSDLDCTSLTLDLVQEIKRGRRLSKEIVEIFEKIEQYPDFYQASTKTYNTMIHSTAAMEYPILDTPAALFGRLLAKEGKASPYTLISLSRVEMFIPPIERETYRNTFLAEVERNSHLMTPQNVAITRFFIKRLSWITTFFRMCTYAFGVSCTLYLLVFALNRRNEGRKYRDLQEKEMFAILDEKYYGNSTASEAGRSSAVKRGRAGVVMNDEEL